MSLELEIAKLTAAVTELTRIMSTGSVQGASPVPAPVILAAPAPVAAPVAAPEPAPVQPASVMPPLPVFTPPPAPAPAAPAAPFSDAKGLMEYVMARYKALGPTNGAKIHGVLVDMGCSTITNVKPEQYPAFYAQAEAIK